MTTGVNTQLAAVATALQGRDRGLFIAFEGGDGSGKTTQIRLLSERLQPFGTPLLATFEPGATDLGRQLRELVQHGPEDVDPRTEALLYAADRAYHVATMIRPALAAGTTVMTDRYIDSSVAYQGIGRGLGEGEVRDLSLWATDNLLPDFVLVLDIDPVDGMRRVGGERDRLERAGTDFHQRVTDHYRAAAAADPDRYWIVDAAGSEEEVFAGIVNALARALRVVE